MANTVWTEGTLRESARSLGYYPVKILAHRNDYWYLVKIRPSKEPFFVGRNGKDFIDLGPLGNADAVYAVIKLLEAQKEARERAAQEEETEEQTDR